MAILILIIITISIGYWFAVIEIPVAFSGLKATEVVRGRYWGIIILFFILAGGCFLSQPYRETIEKEMVPVTSYAVSMVIALSASLAVLLNFRLLKYGSIVYAIVGALAAYDFFIGVQAGIPHLMTYILVWFVVPALTGIIAYLLYKAYRYFISKSKIHLLILTPYLRFGLLAVAVILALFVGVNNGSLLMLLNVPASLGIHFFWNQFSIGEDYILFVFSVVFLGALLWHKASGRIKKMSEGKFDVNIEFVLIALTASAIVLGLFSVPVLIRVIGLPVVPLSVASLLLGGFWGINIAKNSWSRHFTEEIRMQLSILTTPVTSFLLAGFVFSLVDMKSFVSEKESLISPHRETVNITPPILVLAALSVFFLIIIYVRKQQHNKTQTELILLENKNKLFENQKAMAALQISTMISENENLNSKLELRRKELINIALSISEQKEFLEKIGGELNALKEKESMNDIKESIERIEKQLHQRMNYSQELESFYSQVETIHRDFNLRLTEKYPKLTEQEKRLITLLRLGFSSKHIASLMNIAPKSVEISRHRLRAKMGLCRNDNLIQFIKLI